MMDVVECLQNGHSSNRVRNRVSTWTARHFTLRHTLLDYKYTLFGSRVRSRLVAVFIIFRIMKFLHLIVESLL